MDGEAEALCFGSALLPRSDLSLTAPLVVLSAGEKGKEGDAGEVRGGREEAVRPEGAVHSVRYCGPSTPEWRTPANDTLHESW